MLKPFMPFSGKVAQTTEKGVFTIDDAWKAQAVELVGVIPSKVRKFNGHVWVGAKLHTAGTPHTKIMAILRLQVGRNRSNRFVVSDGDVWADVYGSYPKDSWRPRAWISSQKGPWKMVELVQARPLTLNAQLVIRPAIEALMLGETNPGKLSLED